VDRAICWLLCAWSLLEGGVRLRENSPCHSIDTASAGAIVLGRRCVVEQRRSSSSRRLLPLVRAIPVKGHLLGYRLAPGSLGPILWSDHTYILQAPPDSQLQAHRGVRWI